VARVMGAREWPRHRRRRTQIERRGDDEAEIEKSGALGRAGSPRSLERIRAPPITEGEIADRNRNGCQVPTTDRAAAHHPPPRQQRIRVALEDPPGVGERPGLPQRSFD